MKRYLLAALLACLALPAMALEVLATVPEWGALAREIGGSRVNVQVATTALQDPHRIEARPSLLARARRAELLLVTGAELEIGWLPLLLRDSGNRAIQPGQPGYFEAAAQVSLLDVPKVLDRAHGDVHPGGNPHVHLDPRRLLVIGQALAERMAQVDPANAAAYRQGGAEFSLRWKAAMLRWEQQARPLRGVGVWSHHASFRYLEDWLGLRALGTLEPKPGVEPSSGHLTSLLQRQAQEGGKLILRAPYQQEGASRWLADKAGIPALMLPYTVGGTAEATDLAALFDDTLNRLAKALPR